MLRLGHSTNIILKGPQTLRETSFIQSFGHDLRIAREHLKRYRITQDGTEIQQAWDVYYSVFQRLGKQLKLLNVIELQYVSPKLMAVRDLDIAVPGTYQSGKPIIGIKNVIPTFKVIASKQKPRQCSMRGMDGKEYAYCLKGKSSRNKRARAVANMIFRSRGLATRRACHATLWFGQHSS